MRCCVPAGPALGLHAQQNRARSVWGAWGRACARVEPERDRYARLASSACSGVFRDPTSGPSCAPRGAGLRPAVSATPCACHSSGNGLASRTRKARKDDAGWGSAARRRTGGPWAPPEGVRRAPNERESRDGGGMPMACRCPKPVAASFP